MTQTTTHPTTDPDLSRSPVTGAEDGHGHDDRPTRRRTGRIAVAVIAYLVTFLIVLPILWIALLSLEPSNTILSDPLSLKNLTFDNYRDAIASLPLVRMYKNTIIVAVISVTVGAVVSFMASYALTRMVFRRRAAQTSVRFYFLAGLAVPVYVLLFPIYRIDLALGVFGTYAALILPYIAVSIPFNTLLLTGFLREYPAELEEAAIMDGAGPWTRFWKITLPGILGPLSVALVLRAIEAFKVFDIIYVMTRGGPADATKTASFFVYQESFSFLRAGSGAAYALTVTAISGVLIALYIVMLRRQARTA